MCLPSFPGHPINGMGSGNEASVTLLPTYSTGIALADMIDMAGRGGWGLDDSDKSHLHQKNTLSED